MTVEAWHFLRDDGCLNYPPHDRVEVGQTLRINGEPRLCERGFHAAERVLDALKYAPGGLICRVVVGGTIVRDNNKLVGTERTVLWMADATRTLHEFACDQAGAALDRTDDHDIRSHAAIETKRRWLRGEASDSELAAAWDAAWDAAWAAAGTAAGTAAWAAAGAAAWDAARVAAGAAARAAAWNAAWAAAGAAAWDAARAAAWNAAWDAAWAAANDDLTSRLMALAPKEEQP